MGLVNIGVLMTKPIEERWNERTTKFMKFTDLKFNLSLALTPSMTHVA